jgi:hypothetical protein
MILSLLPSIQHCINTLIDYIFMEALNNSSMNYQSTKKGKCDFPFFLFIFNDLLVIENDSTSLCCGNPELIRVSLYIRHPGKICPEQE